MKRSALEKEELSFFPITHAYPGTFGLAIGTEQGYIVSQEMVSRADQEKEGTSSAYDRFVETKTS